MPDAADLSKVPFPVDSFKEAAPHLRRPFSAEAVKWKVQSGKLVVPYIDARLVAERLNKVVPHLWCDDYEPLAGGKGLLCLLSIDGITRRDVGSGYEGKGLFSDAFKRAAVKFGIGVSLYALPKVFLKPESGQLRESGKDKKGKPIYALTDQGRARLDSGYRNWLEKAGVPMFGPVLDHGDVADALGDVEAETDSAPSEFSSGEEPQPKKLTDAKASALIDGAEKLYRELPKASKGADGLPPAAFKRALEGASTDHSKLEALVDDLKKRGEGHA